MTPEMVEKMRWLITKAQVITPNFTEVCLLLGEPYSPEADVDTLKGWLRRLSATGPETVVATSVPLADEPGRKAECTSVLAYERSFDLGRIENSIVFFMLFETHASKRIQAMIHLDP